MFFIDQTYDIVKQTIENNHNSVSAQFAGNRLLEKFFNKYEGDSMYARQLTGWCEPREREMAAYKKFEHANSRCELFNPRYDAPLSNFSSDVLEHLTSARAIITDLLGDISFSELVHGYFDVPKKATSECESDQHSFPLRFSGILNGSTYAWRVWRLRFNSKESFWKNLTASCSFRETTCCKLSFVSKNYKTKRSIMPMPMIDLCFQLVAGHAISTRLKRVGIDLSIQTRNQELARRGSIGEGYSTIDLSSASDLVSCGLVKFLLGDLPELYNHLANIRVGHYKYKGGDVRRMHMFSNMGNGFTFPLQTVVFYALCKAVYGSTNTKGQPLCYGDDIIVRDNIANKVMDLLYSVGLQVNVEKSFNHGCFRESCGADWYNGDLVTPILPKGDWERDHYARCVFINTFERWCHHHGFEPPTISLARVLGCGFVPYWCDDHEGVKVRPRYTSNYFDIRWSKGWRVLSYDRWSDSKSDLCSIHFNSDKLLERYLEGKPLQNIWANALGVLHGSVTNRLGDAYCVDTKQRYRYSYCTTLTRTHVRMRQEHVRDVPLLQRPREYIYRVVKYGSVKFTPHVLVNSVVGSLNSYQHAYIDEAYA